ncbi:hypothetical protein A0130_14820 [Leifsonia xyli]|uniref:hypothetical protein n=1 Tax=Leifsonia xyli TaxID=1575 RepID=UPI0007CDE306|nr:hypothetical protein A0130_14820 [Leifsonia xyli]
MNVPDASSTVSPGAMLTEEAEASSVRVGALHWVANVAEAGAAVAPTARSTAVVSAASPARPRRTV